MMMMDPYPSEVISRLWLGSRAHATMKPWLQQHHITDVLNIGAPSLIDIERLPNVRYHDFVIEDTPRARIGSLFDPCYRIITKALNENPTNNVLVHCFAGVSRSTTIVASFLMRFFGMSRQAAIKWIKQTRPIIQPNPGFLHQLDQFQYWLSSPSQ